MLTNNEKKALADAARAGELHYSGSEFECRGKP